MPLIGLGSLFHPKCQTVKILDFSVIGLLNSGLWACPEQCPKLVKSACWVREFPQQSLCPKCSKSSRLGYRVADGVMPSAALWAPVACLSVEVLPFMMLYGWVATEVLGTPSKVTKEYLEEILKKNIVFAPNHSNKYNLEVPNMNERVCFINHRVRDIPDWL
ncbi:hypothetical protein PIB30_035407 [Stylosanthes scabra]|uniref:Uncharacterized protein n=1 Tax=Stylosanthes scabra TaxID=79078 RepID=A0ABU6QEF8_9FABA|nr:hypothetical protein [Stylosanthes scabra]